MNNEIKEILEKFDEEVKEVGLIRNPYSEKNKKFKKCLIYLSEEHCNIFKDTLDYITNLQEENEKIKEDNYELEKYINEEEGFVKDENRELGLIIDEAVEYNNKNIHSQKLNNILQGSDDNE